MLVLGHVGAAGREGCRNRQMLFQKGKWVLPESAVLNQKSGICGGMKRETADYTAQGEFIDFLQAFAYNCRHLTHSRFNGVLKIQAFISRAASIVP